MDPADSLMPLGLINIAVTVVGLWYSILLLVRGPGGEKTIPAKVCAVEKMGDVTLITIRPEKKMTVCPGQFAFLATPNEEKHPFSIAQSLPNGEFLFAVKALGDFTSEKVPIMSVGEDISIEGPWGGFTPELFSGKTELWLAGGVGIAPFCAWLDGRGLNFRNI